MNRIPALSSAQVEALAKALGDCGTGSDVTRIFNDLGLEDRSCESTKWRRLDWAFRHVQQEDRCANRVLAFVQAFMAPERFVGRADTYDEHRTRVNEGLAFSGLELGPDGKIRQCETARTLEEAERRLRTLRTRLQGRRIHPEVLKYCRAELMQENYFHAVFEATKGLAQRLRDLSGIHIDGAMLVDAVLAVDRPLLAFNSLQTETERSEHKGFAMLLKGCFGAVRNPLAHEPKIMWDGEDDAADYMSLVSLLHRKLDMCAPTPWNRST